MKKWLGMVLTLAVAGILIGTIIIPAVAQGDEPDVGVPASINYQGYLTDGANPVTGPVDITFTIYTSGGTPVWSEKHFGIEPSDGLFSVELGGSGSPMSAVVFDGDRELGVKVGADSEMNPRQKITSVAYALQSEMANNANTLDGMDSDEFICVTGGTINASLDGAAFTVVNTGSGNGIHGNATGSGIYGGKFESSFTYGRGVAGGAFGSDAVGVRGYTTGENGRAVYGTAGGSAGIGVYGECNSGTGVGVYGKNASGIAGYFEGELWVTSALIANSNVGIGTTEPLYWLHVNGQSISGINSIASGTDSAIGGGFNNTASGGLSTVAGGVQNIASGDQSTVSGGWSNEASGNQGATIGGGYNNTASGTGSTVGGGLDNTASHWYSTVSGGQNNFSGNWHSAIGGGVSNIANGDNSVIAGGMNNGTFGSSSAIGGGQYNTANGDWSTVGGGVTNSASGSTSTVGGGQDNTASGISSIVGGGLVNTASGDWSTIGGGYNNIASGTFNATIGGGGSNVAAGDGSTVGGGADNTAGKWASTVSGGQDNIASGNASTICGGAYNIASGIAATIVGGGGNIAAGDSSFAGGKYMRSSASADNTFIWGHAETASGTITASNAFLIFPYGTSGKVGIGTTDPTSALQVEGYIQLDTITSAPPVADCDEASERGRMKLDIANDLCYFCTNSGWIAK